MLIIARHARSDSSRYHNLSGLSAAVSAGADMLSISARLTADNVLVLARHAHLKNDKKEPRIRSLTLKELRKRTAGTHQPIATLEEALKKVLGVVMVEIVIEERGAVRPLLALLEKYLTRKQSRDGILISSSNILALRALRRQNKELHLGMIHRMYALTFLTWQPILRLSVVGFHRLHVNQFVIEAAHKLDLLTYACTVNRKEAAKQLELLGLDAIVTDTPERFAH